MAGDQVGILGPNGAGKSTLLMLLGGLLEPSAGRVRYFDEIEDADAIRDRLAVVLQEPDQYLFNPTVRADLEYGPSQLDVPSAVAERRVRAIASELSLTTYLEQPPFRLSGGEKRRAAIAAGLTTNPDVLLIDEPFNDVGGTHTQDVLGLLQERMMAGETTIFATSETDLVPHVADRVLVLDREGQIARRGGTREILTDLDGLRECGLHPPRVTQLFAAVGEDDPPLTVDEGVTRLCKDDELDFRRSKGPRYE